SSVDTAVLARDFRQVDELRRRNHVGRRHQQRRGKPHCAFTHGEGHLFLHGFHFGGGGGGGALALPRGPEPSFPDVGADVGGDVFLLDVVEIASQRLPGALSAGRAHGTLRITLAEDHGGDALPDHALALWLGEQGVVRVVVHVDKAGRYDQVLCVDG